MDKLVPDQEIYALKSTKIPEKSEFYMRVPKWLSFYTNIIEMSNLIKFDQNIFILRILQPFYFLVSL